MSRWLFATRAQSLTHVHLALLSNLRNKLWVQSNPTPQVQQICRHHSGGAEAEHEILAWCVQLGQWVGSGFTGDKQEIAKVFPL